MHVNKFFVGKCGDISIFFCTFAAFFQNVYSKKAILV